MSKGIEKALNVLRYHVADSTALLVSTHPIYSAFETGIADMSDDVSLKMRLYITGLTYAGLGWVVGKCRDLSKKSFNITAQTKERIHSLHDSVYLATINLVLSSGLYAAAGETNLKKIAIGTGMGVAFGIFMGSWVGYAIDGFRDLTGLQECERKSYPTVIRKQSPKVKKSLAILLTATSIGLMGAVYSITSDSSDLINRKETQREERMSERNNQGLENVLKEEKN